MILLVFKGTQCVFCEVGTEFLNIVYMDFGTQVLKDQACLYSYWLGAGWLRFDAQQRQRY
jgi:hypothetical protein